MVARGEPVELPSSLLVSPKFSYHFHQTSPGFSSLCAQGFLQTLSVWLFSSHPQGVKGGDVNGGGFELLLQVFLELGFHHPTAEFANVKFLYRAAL